MDTYRTAMNKSRIGNGHITEQQWTSLVLAMDTYITAVNKSRIGPGLGGRGGGIQDIKKCMGICNDCDKS